MTNLTYAIDNGGDEPVRLHYEGDGFGMLEQKNEARGRLELIGGDADMFQAVADLLRRLGGQTDQSKNTDGGALMVA